MFYLIAFLLPAAALLIVGKPIQAAVNLLFYGAVWLFVFSPIIAPFFLWVAAATHALLAVIDASPARQHRPAPAPRRALKARASYN